MKLKGNGPVKRIVLDTDADRKPRPELNLAGQRRLQEQNRKAAVFMENDPDKFRSWLERAWAAERHNLLRVQHREKLEKTDEQQDN